MPTEDLSAQGGLLIVTLPGQGAVGKLQTHYFDPRAQQGKIRDALVRWFAIWGIPLTRSTANPSWLEAHTEEVIWCDEVPAHLHGPQTVKYFVQTADRVVHAIETLRPKLILVLSAYLYEAMADDAVAPRISAVIGKAKSAPRRITTMRLKALEQRFEYTFELAWKTLQDLLRYKGYEFMQGPNGTLRKAFEDGLISNHDGWRRMAQARVTTSHTYNEGDALAITRQIFEVYSHLLKRLDIKLNEEKDKLENETPF